MLESASCELRHRMRMVDRATHALFSEAKITKRLTHGGIASALERVHIASYYALRTFFSDQIS